MMTHDKATDTTDCELPDAQTEATTSSLFCTVLHFSKCRDHKSSDCACYIVAARNTATGAEIVRNAEGC